MAAAGRFAAAAFAALVGRHAAGKHSLYLENAAARGLAHAAAAGAVLPRGRAAADGVGGAGDNAYALGGIKETNNIALQFNDMESKQEVWQVIITKIVENVNKVDVAEMKESLREGVRRALEPLPAAK